MMRILQELVNLERERNSHPSYIKRVFIWLKYRSLLWFGVEKVINQTEYPNLITLLRDFALVVDMCKIGVHKDTSKVKTYLPVLRYDLMERHASDDHYFLNSRIHYYTMVLTHPILTNVYILSFNSAEPTIDTSEYMFESKKDKDTFINNRSINKITEYKVHKYDMDGSEYNSIFAAMIIDIIKELVTLIEKEGIDP